MRVRIIEFAKHAPDDLLEGLMRFRCERLRAIHAAHFIPIRPLVAEEAIPIAKGRPKFIEVLR